MAGSGNLINFLYRMITGGVFCFIWLASSCLFVSCDDDDSLFPKEAFILGEYLSDENSKGVEKFQAELDAHISLNETCDSVLYGALVDGVPVLAVLYLDVDNREKIVQRIILNSSIEQCRKDNNVIYGNTTYLLREYTYGLRIDDMFLGKAMPLEREYNTAAQEWSDWHYAENSGYGSDNYGANIAILGASFAYNTRGGGMKNLPWSDGTYGLQDFIAEQFNSSYVDNYAQGGHGSYTGPSLEYPWAFFVYNTYVQTKMACEYMSNNNSKYDLFLLFGGINDYAQSVPLGNCMESENDNTYCGGVIKAINNIRNFAPDAKIYMISSFKCFNVENYGDAIYNSDSDVRNDVGHSFNDYFNAYKDIAEVYDIPFLDVYSIQNVNIENCNGYYLEDMVHPNGNGYYDVAWEIVKFLSTE